MLYTTVSYCDYVLSSSTTPHFLSSLSSSLLPLSSSLFLQFLILCAPSPSFSCSPFPFLILYSSSYYYPIFCYIRRTKMTCPKQCHTWSPTSKSKQELLWWWVYWENLNSFPWGDSRTLLSFALVTCSANSPLIICYPSHFLSNLPYYFFPWCHFFLR